MNIFRMFFKRSWFCPSVTSCSNGFSLCQRFSDPKLLYRLKPAHVSKFRHTWFLMTMTFCIFSLEYLLGIPPGAPVVAHSLWVYSVYLSSLFLMMQSHLREVLRHCLLQQYATLSCMSPAYTAVSQWFEIPMKNILTIEKWLTVFTLSFQLWKNLGSLIWSITMKTEPRWWNTLWRRRSG